MLVVSKILYVRILCKNFYFLGGLYSNSCFFVVFFFGGVFFDVSDGGVLFFINYSVLLFI